MKKLLVFFVVFLVLVGCSREDQVVAPINEKISLAEVNNGIPSPLPIVPLIDASLIKVDGRWMKIGSVPGGFEIDADLSFLPKGYELEVVMVVFEEGEVADVSVYRRGSAMTWTWIGTNRIKVLVENRVRNFRCVYVLCENGK
jgi:hypothetical protein